MKKIITLIISLVIICGISISVWIFFSKEQKNKKYPPKNFIGIYVDFNFFDSSGNKQENPLPEEMRWLSVADYLEICEKIEKGWCKLSKDSATATPKGYMDNLRVRTFYLKELKKELIK